MKRYKNDIEKLIKWYGKQPTCERVAVHQEQVKIFRRALTEKRKTGQEANVSGELNYEAFCNAIGIRYRLHHDKLDNRQDLKAVEAIRRNVIKNKDIFRPSTVRDKITNNLYQTIKVLRDEGFSWSKVSTYLEKNHKTKISVAYLQRIWTERERQTEMEREAVNE